MEKAPVPPHERPWRHPSEVAAAQRAALRAEEAAPSTRVFALVTGTLGLLAVGVLVMSVTPGREESPIALSVTTVSIEALHEPSAAEMAAAATLGARMASALASGVTHATIWPDRAAARPVVLATPIGDGRRAVATATALGDRRPERVLVELRSGRIAIGEVIGATSEPGLVVLTLGAVIEPGRRLAPLPAADEVVTVLSDPPVEVALADVASLEVAEGTAVVDARGALVGLCTNRPGAPVDLVAVSGALGVATTDVR